ncbi:MAG: hypothetical protein ABJG41_17105 [Cyclobacteriaceae bacterium]
MKPSQATDKEREALEALAEILFDLYQQEPSPTNKAPPSPTSTKHKKTDAGKHRS